MQQRAIPAGLLVGLFVLSPVHRLGLKIIGRISSDHRTEVALGTQMGGDKRWSVAIDACTTMLLSALTGYLKAAGERPRIVVTLNGHDVELNLAALVSLCDLLIIHVRKLESDGAGENEATIAMTTHAYLTTTHAAEEYDNATLLARAAQGDQFARRLLIDKYDDLVRSVARSFRLQAADVNDVAQTTWLRLLHRTDTIRDPQRLAKWLAVTATHESLAVRRHAFRQGPAPAAHEMPDATVDLEADVVTREAQDDLWSAVAAAHSPATAGRFAIPRTARLLQGDRGEMRDADREHRPDKSTSTSSAPSKTRQPQVGTDPAVVGHQPDLLLAFSRNCRAHRRCESATRLHQVK